MKVKHSKSKNEKDLAHIYAPLSTGLCNKEKCHIAFSSLDEILSLKPF